MAMAFSFEHGGIEDVTTRDEIMKLSNVVLGDPDDFEGWEKLVAYAEQLEGGPTRNSSPQAIAAYREAFDRLLEKFPLMFGYWKKYAEREFLVAGPESAQMIYERGVASISNSVDLWTGYCQFMMEVHHNAEQVEALFDRAAECVGLDFHAHLFWDLYLEFETRNLYTPNAKLHGEFEILRRIVQIPLYHYAKYSTKFTEACANQPTSAMCPADVYAQVRSEITMDPQSNKTEDEIDKAIRDRIEHQRKENSSAVQQQVQDRWTYEQYIKKGYFHVEEMDPTELENWEKYLQFEILQKDYKRIVTLFERCLVPTAYYDKFWLMYAHYMLAQKNKTEELRSIYIRASCLFAPIARPTIRLEWALFEEMMGRPTLANDIYHAVLDLLPGNLETVKALCHATRRREGPDQAIETWTKQLALMTVDARTRAIMISELARFSTRAKESGDFDQSLGGRRLFQSNVSKLSESPEFWGGYLSFEIEQPQYKGKYDVVKGVFDQIRKNTSLDREVIVGLADLYKSYLLERGPDNAAKEVMTLTHEVDGAYTRYSNDFSSWIYCRIQPYRLTN